VGVNICFYLRVDDVDEALAALRERGFFESAGGLEDPAPGVIGDPDEIVRRHLCRAFVRAVRDRLDGLSTPMVMSRQDAERWLSYWTFDRWPMNAQERSACMVHVARVRELGAALGGKCIVALADAGFITELSWKEVAERAAAIEAGDPERISAD
jgi:hypothetical protein